MESQFSRPVWTDALIEYAVLLPALMLNVWGGGALPPILAENETERVLMVMARSGPSSAASATAIKTHPMSAVIAMLYLWLFIACLVENAPHRSRLCGTAKGCGS